MVILPNLCNISKSTSHRSEVGQGVLFQVGSASCSEMSTLQLITWKEKGYQMKETSPSFKAPLGRMRSGASSCVMPLLLLLSLSLCQIALAVSPPPDGGYGGGNTAEGTQALQSLTTGIYDSAFGFQALFYNTTSNF